MSKAKQTDSSTALARERQLAPIIAVVFVFCTYAGLRPLAATAVHLWHNGPALGWFAWTVACVCWVGLVGANVHYLVTHRKTTVGMAPIAVISMAPSAAVTLAYAHAYGPALVALWVVFGISFALLVIFAFGFVKLRSVYVGTPPIAPDAIVIVLGGTVRDGVPCSTLTERLKTASALWHDSFHRALVLTGGPVPNDTRCEADYMFDELVARSVDPRSLHVEPAARNTAENIQNSLALLARTNLWMPGDARQLCVLTSDYHLFRALREGRYCDVELVPIPSPTPRKSRLQQWCREILTDLVLP